MPELSNLRVTSPVTRGQELRGSVTAYDQGGLGELRLNTQLTGPTSFSREVIPQGATDAFTLSDVSIRIFIPEDAPPGRYAMEMIAEDQEGLESEPVRTLFNVQ